MNIHLLLQMASEAMGDRTAVVCGDMRLTYAQMAEQAAYLAAKIKSGQKMTYLHEAHPVMPAALFGAALAGTPFVPINYRLAQDQIVKLLQRTSPALMISGQSISVDGIETLPPAQLSSQSYDGQAPDVDGATAIELFTSGTTGEPKSAILKHKNLMSYIFGTTEFMSADENEATLISVPPYHIAGISAVLSSTYAGRRMVQLPNFSPAEWLRLAKRESITHAFLVPTMLQRILEYAKPDPSALDLPNLAFLAYGGGKMPLDVIKAAIEALPHVNFTNAYGLTETSSTIAILTPDDHRDALAAQDAAIQRRLGSVGKALPSVEIQIRDENDCVCRAETAGLVFVRGDQISGEYKGIGTCLDKDGWFPTKDRGYLDADGFLFLDGRDDDVIVRGGENISPGEVEDCVRSMNGVSDVAVIGIPDTEWGEAVAAIVVCDGTATEHSICEHVRVELRSSRVPSAVKFVDELPYNETGKLLRRVLRAEFENRQ